MNWLEIIEFRTADCNRELLKSRLQKLIHDVQREVDKKQIKVYSRFMENSDFSIHLLHNTPKIESIGSPLGLHVASSLKQFGLVNHEVWIEQIGV